ncbi:hypothetical protein HID58_014816 [Brassica napus]|uniref:DUF577 domain-containing protein n=1 Tax=Brassica napus TaxID=3708 RepID=A0ABQ8DIC5_BRANA|nr:hypothetical protein HID58_014816 [Brassica napus]
MGRVMAEPPNLMLQARELLATPSHELLESLVNHLSTRQETTEYQTAMALFKFCTVNFANSLTLKLLQMYRSSSDALLRSKSIVVLSQTLAAYKSRRFELSLVALREIKPLVISCLRMQETEIKLFRRIVSFIAHDVVMLDNGGWDELSDCIVELSSAQPLKALHVFVDLPPVYGRFIYSCFGKIAERAEKVLLMPDQDRVEDWSLGLQAVVKLGIQVLDFELRFDMVKGLLTLLVKAASDLVDKGMEEFLIRGLADLEMFLSRDKKLYNYNKEQCDFVSCFLYKIKDLGPLTKQATGKIHRLVKSTPSLVVQKQQGHAACSEREWLDRLNNLQPLEILKVFASTDVEERFRELAIRRLNVVLSDRVSREKSADMKELQPLLLSCLSSKERISESMFKVLGEVVYHVAFEMTNFHFETWYDLSDCIASTSETEFERAVYIFQCLTMWLDDEFMVPIMETSAVEEMADKMVDSVRELVERKMEVGLVRRAFRDLESIVKKQKDWFGDNEYKLTKSLLLRLYVIKGMTMDSKMVLWRINVFVERGMADLAEVEPDGAMGRVMAEPPPPNLMLKARDVLATPSHQGLESVVTHLFFMAQETTEYQTANALFNFLTLYFANCLTLKLLHLYRSSSIGVHRSHLIYLLFETLQDYKNRRFELSLVALNEIKPLLVSCLRMQEPEIINLRRIVSFIAHDVMILDNGGWDELSECIYEISCHDPLKALHVFVDLPPVYERFVHNCGGMVVEKAEKVLLVPYQDRVDDWSLGLQAVVKLGIQVLDSEMKVDMVKRLLALLVKAASDLVAKGMEEFLVRGLADLERFLEREKRLYNYNKDQCEFVSCFLFKIKDLGPLTYEATERIHRMVKSTPSRVHGACSEGEWFDRLNNLPPLEILRIFASTDVEERFRDMAIRGLNVLLSDYVSREEESTDASLLRELQLLLISCLWEKEGITESMFRVLGEVVYHVAFEMMTSHVELWDDLGYYITSHIETDFQRAVYVFQCLTMWLHEEFIDPIMADKMVDSVRELVERKLEVGFVRRAFRDFEIIVKKQMEWFRMNEYKLTKSLLLRLYVIKGMTMDSKMVLWRINVFVERGMADHLAA